MNAKKFFFVVALMALLLLVGMGSVYAQNENQSNPVVQTSETSTEVVNGNPPFSCRCAGDYENCQAEGREHGYRRIQNPDGTPQVCPFASQADAQIGRGPQGSSRRMGDGLGRQNAPQRGRGQGLMNRGKR